MPPVRLIACLAIVGAVVPACKSTTTPPTPVPTTLALSVSAISLSVLGDFATITATVRDQNGNAMTDQTVSWGVADAAVAGNNSGRHAQRPTDDLAQRKVRRLERLRRNLDEVSTPVVPKVEVLRRPSSAPSGFI